MDKDRKQIMREMFGDSSSEEACSELSEEGGLNLEDEGKAGGKRRELQGNTEADQRGKLEAEDMGQIMCTLFAEMSDEDSTSEPRELSDKDGVNHEHEGKLGVKRKELQGNSKADQRGIFMTKDKGQIMRALFGDISDEDEDDSSSELSELSEEGGVERKREGKLGVERKEELQGNSKADQRRIFVTNNMGQIMRALFGDMSEEENFPEPSENSDEAGVEGKLGFKKKGGLQGNSKADQRSIFETKDTGQIMRALFGDMSDEEEEDSSSEPK